MLHRCLVAVAENDLNITQAARAALPTFEDLSKYPLLELFGVREGLGVGILSVRDGTHLFPVHTNWVGIRRGVLLRGFMYDFLQMLAPHLSPRLVQSAEGSESQDAVDQHFSAVKIPFPR